MLPLETIFTLKVEPRHNVILRVFETLPGGVKRLIRFLITFSTPVRPNS